MARTVWLVYAYTEFGVLLKGRQHAAVVKGWWPESFHQAANVSERGLLQVTRLPQGFCCALASWRQVHGSTRSAGAPPPPMDLYRRGSHAGLRRRSSSLAVTAWANALRRACCRPRL